jgi:hypothetical protein
MKKLFLSPVLLIVLGTLFGCNSDNVTKMTPRIAIVGHEILKTLER